MQKKLFTELGLSPELLKAIAKVGYEEASPIQSEAIPVLLGGSDVVGQSQTGSGKTAAFSIPAIELVDPSVRAPQVLVLCPTRELAVQVAEEVAKLAFFKRGVRELPIYGGQSYERQFKGLQQGAQIIIGTPGRVMDHLERGTLKLGAIKMVILDEADRMLDMGFVDDIKNVLGQMPPERQTVLFSATLPPPIQQLVKSFTRNPVNVRIEAQALTVPNIDQVYYEVDRRFKVEALCRLVDIQNIKYGIIFCATKMMVDELTEHLSARGYSADKLHGDMSQAMRERVMVKFRKRGLEFLVATDVAARGVDVDDLEVVFNYDLPQDGEDYVHRIGRTGRAGRNGRAITFVSGRELYKLQNIIRFTKGRIRRERVPSAEEVEAKRTNEFFETLRETLEKGEYKRHDEVIEQLLDEGYASTDISSALINLIGGGTTEKTRPTAGGGAGKESVEEIILPSRADRTGRTERSKQSDGTGEDFRPSGRFNQHEQGGSEESRPSSRTQGKRDEKRPAKERSRTSDKNEPRTSSAEPGMIRLALNVGREQEIAPGDVVGVIAGLAKVKKQSIGAIHLMAKQTFVDVAKEDVGIVLEKLQGIDFKGHSLSIKKAK